MISCTKLSPNVNIALRLPNEVFHFFRGRAGLSAQQSRNIFTITEVSDHHSVFNLTAPSTYLLIP